MRLGRHGGYAFGVLAISAGLVVLGAGAILFTPVVHRLLHKFHQKETERGDLKETERGDRGRQ